MPPLPVPQKLNIMKKYFVFNGMIAMASFVSLKQARIIAGEQFAIASENKDGTYLCGQARPAI